MTMRWGGTALELSGFDICFGTILGAPGRHDSATLRDRGGRRHYEPPHLSEGVGAKAMEGCVCTTVAQAC